jgi:hypothetical protein
MVICCIEFNTIVSEAKCHLPPAITQFLSGRTEPDLPIVDEGQFVDQATDIGENVSCIEEISYCNSLKALRLQSAESPKTYLAEWKIVILA